MVLEIDLLFQKAAASRGAGQLSDAELRYRQILEIDPRNLVALCNLGLLLLQQRRFEAAEAIWRQAVAVDKRSAEAHHGLAGALTGSQQLSAAVRHYEKSIGLQPAFVEAFNNLGYVLQLQGKAQAAIERYQQALKIRPIYPEALNNLGNAQQELKQFEAALTSYDRALAIRADYAEALHNKANVLCRLGRDAEAVTVWERTLALYPSFAAARVGLGDALQRLDRADEAMEQYQRAISDSPNEVDGYLHLGDLLFDRERVAEAAQMYERATALDSGNPEAHNALGTAFKALGQAANARRSFERAIALAPDQPAGYYNLVYSQKVDPGDPSVRAMRKMEGKSARLSDEQQMFLLFALAKAAADDGDQRQSFDYLRRANRIAHRRASYDESRAMKLADELGQVFTPELLGQRTGVGCPSRLPVFVVGMPRSGTTLVEQILASHPEVFGAGELNGVNRAASSLARATGDDYPQAVIGATEAQLREVGENYVSALRACDSSASRIVDKMPTNFFHLGLINLTLPNARIIHIRRDPVDTAMSCFSLLFLRRNSVLAAGYSYDLGQLGRFYRTYLRVMEHWRAALPPDVMLEVDYERLVEGFDTEARRMIRHCGLAWDEACANFHQSKRPVVTPSANQVRQPIYKSSIGRWRPDAEQLKPFLDALNGL